MRSSVSVLNLSEGGVKLHYESPPYMRIAAQSVAYLYRQIFAGNSQMREVLLMSLYDMEHQASLRPVPSL
jgi:hypothetical protein